MLYYTIGFPQTLQQFLLTEIVPPLLSQSLSGWEEQRGGVCVCVCKKFSHYKIYGFSLMALA